jgi:ATP-dependent protease ClpP protease subunit
MNGKERVAKPNIRLFGTMDDDLYRTFSNDLHQLLDGNEPIVVELTTIGGEADTGRRIALDLRLAHEAGREIFFVGKTIVYSAGVTVMAAFPAACRYLSRDCMLLIHGRRIDKQVHFYGPLQSNMQIAEEMLAQLRAGMELEREDFEQLIQGSDLNLDEVMKRAQGSWYLSAREALSHRLIAGVI